MLADPRNHSQIWSSGSRVRDAHRHLLLWSKPLLESKGGCLPAVLAEPEVIAAFPGLCPHERTRES